MTGNFSDELVDYKLVKRETSLWQGPSPSQGGDSKRKQNHGLIDPQQVASLHSN
jgi:hypothetical protein